MHARLIYWYYANYITQPEIDVIYGEPFVSKWRYEIDVIDLYGEPFVSKW